MAPGTIKEALGFQVGDNKNLEAPDETSGVRVTVVITNSLADEKGLKVGDLITAMNGIPIADITEFEEALKGLPRSQPLFLLVTREDEAFHMVLND